MFYDGECGVCSNSVQFILKNERDHELYFCPLQSPFAEDLLKEQGITINLDTVYVYANGIIYDRSKAIQVVAKHLKTPYSLFTSLISS